MSAESHSSKEEWMQMMKSLCHHAEVLAFAYLNTEREHKPIDRKAIEVAIHDVEAAKQLFRELHL